MRYDHTHNEAHDSLIAISRQLCTNRESVSVCECVLESERDRACTADKRVGNRDRASDIDSAVYSGSSESMRENKSERGTNRDKQYNTSVYTKKRS